ncbi:hypothetical protein LPJ61_000577 [Coemansia biformis]|uniref:CRAL-TRIO domain-containing protein n=1 Tax=Coemansia biformis TaxID=1286918 RepID=A0A9W8CY17_9FUNG|nr:hypothetical protein LPJ61_000577 [Coemansia biformis]
MNISPIDVDNPTPDQKAGAIEQLRARLSDEVNGYCTDQDIWRFSVARQLDVEKAAAMVSEWYQWRMSACIDKLPVAQPDNTAPVPYPIRGYFSVADANLTAGPQVSETQLKLNRIFGGGCWHKRDKDGHPVYIERAGRYLIKDIPKSSTINGLFEFHFLMQEFLSRTIFPECTQLAGREISQQVVVFDLAGISIGMMSHIPALNMLREMLSKDQLYYPECMYRTYIVNAPSMFVTAWKLIKSWLDPRVISKIRIMGRDHAQELLEQIPATNLPSFLGGTCRCSHMPGGCVPSVPLGNYPDLPRKAFVSLRHQVQISYAQPSHSYVCDITPTDFDDAAPSTPLSSPLMGYASWLGIRRDSSSQSATPSALTGPKTRRVYVRFTADRGRGVVLEVLWREHSVDAADGHLSRSDDLLVYPEALFDPQRAPVVIELETPNSAGQLVFNWRVANFDEGLAPFPGPEEAKVPIQLEYSIDPEECLLKEFGLLPLRHS